MEFSEREKGLNENIKKITLRKIGKRYLKKEKYVKCNYKKFL